MRQKDSLFRADDEKAFVTLVRDQLAKGSAKIRGISDSEYVSMVRKRWASYGTDAVYAMKLLFDPLVQPEYCDDNHDEFYCLLVARIDQNGELVDAPPGYKPPDYPGVHLSHIVAGSPSGGHGPKPSEAAVYLIAYLDVLGFESLLKRVGLVELHRLYEKLLKTALVPNSEAYPWSKARSLVRGEVVPALMWLPIETAYFSDSILMWVPYHPGHVGEFLTRTAKVFCEALDIGLPMRGAIAFGEAILDKESNTFLGAPLVEAARLEKEQNWIGVTIGASFKSNQYKIPVPPEVVFMYTPPVKANEEKLSSCLIRKFFKLFNRAQKTPNEESLLSGLVLDWPRIWRASKEGSALKWLNTLCSAELPHSIRKRYQATTLFYNHSERHQDWFVSKEATKIDA